MARGAVSGSPVLVSILAWLDRDMEAPAYVEFEEVESNYSLAKAYAEAIGQLDADLILPFDARVVEVVEKDRRFPLLMLEFVPGLNDDLPKTVYGHQASADGSLARRGSAVVALEMLESGEYVLDESAASRICCLICTSRVGPVGPVY